MSTEEERLRKQERLLKQHGKKCRQCGKPFIPQPFFRKNYPGACHYPTDTICGFCIYDLDARSHSCIMDQESEAYDEQHYGRFIPE